MYMLYIYIYIYIIYIYYIYIYTYTYIYLNNFKSFYGKYQGIQTTKKTFIILIQCNISEYFLILSSDSKSILMKESKSTLKHNTE